MGKLKDTFRKFMGVEVLGGTQSFVTGQQNGLDNLNRRQLLGEYKGIVFSCINVRSQEVAKYEPLLYVKNPRIVEEQDPLEDHPFLQVLDNPNPNQSKYELVELTQIFMDLTGEAFWYVEVGEVTRQPKAFYCVQPHRVKVAVDNLGHVIGYSIRRDDGVEVPLDVDEMIHFKYPDPLNPLRGKSPVGANLLYIDTEEQISIFQHAFMKNSATPSGVATVKGGITVEAFKLLKKQWKEQQQGSHNAGKTLFIRNGDFTFDKVGLSLSELDMTALSGKSQDDVRKAFRVPKPKLGDTEGQGLGRDGAETVNYVFARDVIDALQTRLDDTLQRYIRVAYKDQNLFVDHICQVPENEAAELEEYKAKVQEWNLGVGRWLTVNAIEEAKGLPLTPGGDQLYRTQTQIPIDETYIPPSIQNNLPKMITRQTIVSKAKELPATTKAMTKSSFFDSLDDLEKSTSARYISTMKPMLLGQKKRILSKLKGAKTLEDDLLVGFPLEEKKTILNIVEVLLADAQKGGDLAAEYVKSDIVYSIPEKYVVALRDDTERVIQGYNAQTSQALRDTITEGLEKGEDFDGLSKRVSDLYDTAEGSRADRIARTETHRIINESVADAYEQSGISAMQWQTDGDACELCQAMDGTITDIGVPFLKVGESLMGVEGKEYTVDYADVQAADLHPNCNCKLVPVTPGSGNFAIEPEKVLVKIYDNEENDRLKEALAKEQEFSLKLQEIIGLDDGA